MTVASPLSELLPIALPTKVDVGVGKEFIPLISGWIKGSGDIIHLIITATTQL